MPEFKTSVDVIKAKDEKRRDVILKCVVQNIYIYYPSALLFLNSYVIEIIKRLNNFFKKE